MAPDDRPEPATKEELAAAVVKLALEIDKRALQSAMDASFAVVNAKLDRMMGALDTVVGKQYDNDQSHVMFGAMLGDHRRALESHDRRLTALESRVPPPAP